MINLKSVLYLATVLSVCFGAVDISKLIFLMIPNLVVISANLCQAVRSDDAEYCLLR